MSAHKQFVEAVIYTDGIEVLTHAVYLTHTRIFQRDLIIKILKNIIDILNYASYAYGFMRVMLT